MSAKTMFSCGWCYDETGRIVCESCRKPLDRLEERQCQCPEWEPVDVAPIALLIVSFTLIAAGFMGLAICLSGDTPSTAWREPFTLLILGITGLWLV